MASCSDDGAGIPDFGTGGTSSVGGGGAPVGGAPSGGGGTGAGGDSIGGSPSGGATGNGGGPPTGGAPPDGLFVEAWHGDTVQVGGPDSFGVPQTFANIVGRIWAPEGLASATYRINDQAEQDLSTGPNNNRLALSGDYNVEVPVSSLAPYPSENHVRIVATDELGATHERDVSIEYRPLAQATIPSLTLDFSALADMDQLKARGAIVDGLWTMESSGLRVMQMGYDRLIAVGDSKWSPGYEVLAEVTLHDYRAYGGLGLAIGWQGHAGTNSPRTDWPLEALGWIRFRPDGAELQIMTFQKNEIVTKPVGVGTGVTYSYRVRSERLGGGTARFTVKVWPTGTSESSATSLTYDLAERAGSVLLVAHHADVTWKKLEVKPVN